MCHLFGIPALFISLPLLPETNSLIFILQSIHTSVNVLKFFLGPRKIQINKMTELSEITGTSMICDRVLDLPAVFPVYPVFHPFSHLDPSIFPEMHGARHIFCQLEELSKGHLQALTGQQPHHDSAVLSAPRAAPQQGSDV